MEFVVVHASSSEHRLQPFAGRAMNMRRALHGEGSGQSVLLIEDNPISAGVISEHLEVACPGARLHHAPTLAAAVRAIHEDSWDVILVDLGLPGVVGLDALRCVREHEPSAAIIVITASDDEALVTQALEEEAQDYLHKQELSAESLTRAIRYALGRQQILVRMRQVAAEAKAQEQNLLDLMRASADGIVILDARREVSFVNSAAETMFGRPSTDMTGHPLALIDVAKEQFELEVESGLGDGNRLFDVRIVPINWLGESGHLAVARDVTERHRGEELRAQLHRSERLAAIGKLAAGIAHEVNNPLTYVMGSLELIKQYLGRLDGVPADAMARLENLCENAIDGTERVVSIVRELGVFSRRDVDEAARPTDIKGVLESALKMVHPQIQHRARVERAYDPVDLVVGHAGRLTQVMVNLLVNAAQSIEEGRVERNAISVRTYQEEDRVYATIQDTGAGIEASALDRLFEPFFTTKGAGEGTGLGLYVCRNIVDAYGGCIRVESSFGTGTRVIVELPVWAGPAEHTTPARVHFEPDAPQRARILVIDDEPRIRDMLVEALGSLHEVVVASSGSEAQALLSHDLSFDVVLCDVVMDDVSGNQLEEWIRGRAPILLDRLVFMSGGEVKPDRVRVSTDGVERLLRKPFRQSDVLDRVQAMLTR